MALMACYVSSPNHFTLNLIIMSCLVGTEECPVKSVVNRVAVQLAKALQNKGMALLVNHGISDEKVRIAQISVAAQST